MADLLPSGLVFQGTSSGALPSGEVVTVVTSGPTDGSGSGAPASVSLTAPVADGVGTGGVTDGTGAGTPSSVSITAPTGSAMGTGASNGTITIPAVVDWNTGTLRVSETGVVVFISDINSGALIVKKTGQTTHATTGVCVVTDALLIAGTSYRVTTVFADGSEGTWRYAAV